jgi:hypothetical protein
MSFDIAALTASQSWWDEAGVWLSGAVALGVAMESVTTFDSLANWLRLNTLERYGLRHGISKAGFLILTAALALEVDAAIQSHDISEQIIAGLNTEIADTQKREQHLIDQSDDLEKTLKYLTTDRTISVPRVADKLKVFGKVPFVMTLTDDRETIELCGQISSALILAGWDWKQNKTSDNSFEQGRSFPGKPFMRMQAGRGVSINIAISDATKLGVSARALKDALVAEQLRNVEEQDLSTSMMDDGKKIYGVVHISVGTRQ